MSETQESAVHNLIARARDYHGSTSLQIVVVVDTLLRAYVEQQLWNLPGVTVISGHNNGNQPSIQLTTPEDSRNRVWVLVGSNVDRLRINVSDEFISLEVLPCDDHRVILDPASTYCGISLFDWDLRQVRPPANRRFTRNHGVETQPMDPPASDGATRSQSFRKNSITLLRTFIESMKANARKNAALPLPWATSALAVGTITFACVCNPLGLSFTVLFWSGAAGSTLSSIAAFCVPLEMLVKWWDLAKRFVKQLLKAASYVIQDVDAWKFMLDKLFVLYEHRKGKHRKGMASSA